MSKRISNVLLSLLLLIGLGAASSISGPIHLNGQTYEADCTCSAPQESTQAEVKCNPEDAQITLEAEGGNGDVSETTEMVESRFGNPSEYTYKQINYEAFMCLDGRVTSENLYTAGGDAGEMILALVVYEAETGKRLKKSDIKSIFEDYLRCMQPETFNLCSDDDAVSHLSTELGVKVSLKDPKKQHQDMILDSIAEPMNMGDLHLRNMLETPGSYMLQDAHVAKAFIEMFFETLWDTDFEFHEKLAYHQLATQHKELAFVDIRNEHQCIIEQTAPVFAARQGDKTNPSYFINHLDAVAIRRAQLAKFFVDNIARNQYGLTIDRMIGQMNKFGLYWLDVTGEYVANGLPFYTVQLENS